MGLRDHVVYAVPKRTLRIQSGNNIPGIQHVIEYFPWKDLTRLVIVNIQPNLDRLV